MKKTESKPSEKLSQERIEELKNICLKALRAGQHCKTVSLIGTVFNTLAMVSGDERRIGYNGFDWFMKVLEEKFGETHLKN